MQYQRGEIVWVKFPFSDAISSKLRPALIISNQNVNTTKDYLLMQITTRLRNDSLSMEITNKDFIDKPLLKPSQLRLHKIFILNESLIESYITRTSNDFMNRVIDNLILLLQ